MSESAHGHASGCDADGDAASRSRYLSFRLGDEEYGFEILRVREIIGAIDVTPLPRTPESIKGVINLRGRIVPVMDLRRRFRMESVPCDERTCIIVVEVAHSDDGATFQMGVVVDTVSEVVDIGRDAIEPAPKFGFSLETDLILGMGKVKGRVITLLAIDRVLAHEDLGGIDAATTDRHAAVA